MADTILIVDDSKSMRQMTSMILKGAGYAVVEAEDGEEGLEKLSDEITLIITDYNMPKRNGVDFIKAVRGGSTKPSVPILMLTTESEEQKKMEGKEAGATGWLTKPFDQEQLLAVVKKVAGPVSI